MMVLHNEAQTTILARLGFLRDSVQLNVLQGVAESSSPTITHSNICVYFHNRYLGDAKFSIATVTVDVLDPA